MLNPSTFPSTHRWDRNFFLTLMSIVWAAIISGFTYDLMTFQAERGFKFPLMVHAHALAFTGWLVLFTVQLVLIRRKNIPLHKQLGILGFLLVPTMVILGTMAAITTERIRFGTPDSSLPFLAVMLGDMVVFGSLAGAGLLLRKNSSAHKRLMLIATFAISDAGFGRWASSFVAPLFGNSYWKYTNFTEGFWPFVGYQLIGPLSLMIALGIYDFITRKRLHPVYVWAVIFYLCVSLFAGWLYYSAEWLNFATRLVH